MFGPRQLALSVEIENQISLCLEPTGIEMNLLQVHVHSIPVGSKHREI